MICALAADHPQFGEAWSRNMVSAERNLPADFDPVSGRNVKWIAELGTESHSTAVVAGGRVFIGTNNGRPRDSKHDGDRGVFMCFEEETGKLLWQLVAPKLEEDIYYDWPKCGISSPGAVEGDRVYVVNNRYQLLCLDVNGMANGNDGPFKDEGAAMTRQPTNAPASNPPLTPGPLDADIIWSYDLFKEAGIWPHDGAHVSILIRGNHLYLNTSTGVDNTHRKIRTPDAPSLIVIDKRTGRLLARDREKIAPNIFHSTWAGPSLGKVGGKEIIAFLGGNGILYGFEPIPESPLAEPITLKKLFEYDPDPNGPKTEVHRFSTNRREGPSNFYGMPVFIDNSIYIAGGGDIFWGKNEAYLKRLNLTNDAGQIKVTEAWTYPLGNHTLSTPAVKDGLVYVNDSKKTIHCVDGETGAALWTHDTKGEYWASGLIADGKVYFGSRSGEVTVFAHGREKKLLSTIELKEKISMTPVAANGVLYIGTMRQLFALKEGAAAAKLR